jgi:hypothetical protein
MIVRSAGAFLVSMGLLVAEAQAHGAVSVEKGVCKLRIGPDEMNFTGYQPDTSRQEFCDDIPDVGRTLIVLDAVQKELRDMSTEIRVIRDIGGPDAESAANLNEVTEAYVAPTKYLRGTIEFQHTFAQPGKFVGLVTVTDDHGLRWLARFPFSVGQTASKELLGYLTGSGVVVVVIGAYVAYAHRRKAAAKKV